MSDEHFQKLRTLRRRNLDIVGDMEEWLEEYQADYPSEVMEDIERWAWRINKAVFDPTTLES